MIRRIQVLKDMHFGPFRTNLRTGDVIEVHGPGSVTINGDVLEMDSGDIERGVDALDKQREDNPVSPWSKEMTPRKEGITPGGKEGGGIKTGTKTQTILPILGCLQAVADFLDREEGWGKDGKKVEWLPSNEEQYQFISRFYPEIGLGSRTMGDLKCKADRSVSVINDWLKQNGFDIRLSEGGGTSFAVASIMDVLVEWIKTGTVTTIRNDRGTFPAVSIKNADDGSTHGYLDRSIHPHKIARLGTKSNDRVYMTVLDYLPDDPFDITEKIRQISKALSDVKEIRCDGVVFPMIDCNQVVNLDWMVGMKTGLGPDDPFVSQAVQQTQFRMNETGARAKSAATMKMSKGSPSVDMWIRIDRPFLLWIKRKGIRVPIFSAVFTEDVWKKPKEL